MYANGSELFLNLATEIAIRYEPHNSADVSGIDKLQKNPSGEQGLPGARRGSQGREFAMAEYRQNARRPLLLPLPRCKFREGKNRGSVVTVGANGQCVVCMRGAADDPRDDMVDVEHLGKIVLAYPADMMLPGGDCCALGLGEQSTRVPALATHLDSRRMARLARTICCFPRQS
jgi:hypothetical protein